MNFYIGQIFGNREVVDINCTEQDWKSLNMKVPVRLDAYVKTRCLNCGSVLPCHKKNLYTKPPKRCVFCSNIGNFSDITTNTNSWIIKDDVAICNVMHQDGVVSFTIDSSDYNVVSQYIWRICKKRQKYYVITGSFKKSTAHYLHHMIYGKPIGDEEVDHIDGNSLNNRRSNLRLVSRQENIDNQRATRIDNRLGIRGIAYSKRDRLYKVDFNYHGQRYYTKSWKTLEEAVWCRKCFEDFFDLPALRNNPLAPQYFTLDQKSRDEIHEYVLDKILGNERY